MEDPELDAQLLVGHVQITLRLLHARAPERGGCGRRGHAATSAPSPRGAAPSRQAELRVADVAYLLPLVIQAALGERTAVEIYGSDYPTPDGTALRDFIHVTDLADAHVRALDVVLSDAAVARLDPVDREDPALDAIVPDSPHKPYDMKHVIERVFDDGELVSEIVPELWMIDGYRSRMEGRTFTRRDEDITVIGRAE